MRGPKPKHIVLVREHLEIVREHLGRRTTEHRIVERARILVLSHEGHGPTEIASLVGCHRATVCRIRGRYQEEGISALHDHPRSGRPRSFSPCR